MDGFGPACLRGGDDPLDVEIALARRGGAQQMRLVRHLHMPRLRIGLGINRDGAKAHALCRPGNPAGDLAAIGDQEGGEGAIGHCRLTS